MSMRRALFIVCGWIIIWLTFLMPIITLLSMRHP